VKKISVLIFGCTLLHHVGMYALTQPHGHTATKPHSHTIPNPGEYPAVLISQARKPVVLPLAQLWATARTDGTGDW